MPKQARLIALDWGTSSLRAYLLAEAGAVIEEVAFPWGIMATPDGDFAKALEKATGAWRLRQPELPMIAAGMIGSAQGWREIPYVACPAGEEELVAAATGQWNEGRAILPIIPGLALGGDIPGVMRGEETQIVGALALAPHLAENAMLVLPGTHSKWVTVRHGKIERFTTYLTGELFAVLSKHSILGRPAQDARTKSENERHALSWQAFDQGVMAISQDPARGLSPLLFSTRSLVLSGRLSASASLDYLSGLLLGEELRCALAERATKNAAPLALIGEKALCERYLRALTLFGITDVPVIEGAAAMGLWRIAAGIVSRTAS
jgi:2-dehydro-3-deoxygalactonokinase